MATFDARALKIAIEHLLEAIVSADEYEDNDLLTPLEAGSFLWHDEEELAELREGRDGPPFITVQVPRYRYRDLVLWRDKELSKIDLSNHYGLTPPVK